jgi:hypothetical protein
VRESLKRELQQRPNQQDMTVFFNKLKAEARAKLLWTPPEEPPSEK